MQNDFSGTGEAIASKGQTDKFRMIAENSSDVIMRFDRECRHLYTNPAASRVFGFSPEEFLGKNHQELGFSKEEYEFWDSLILKVFETGKPHKEVVPIFEGSMHVDWIIEPEFDENGEVVSVLSITRDVTDLIKLNKNLEAANSELEKFFSIIAHDLRSPFFGFLSLSRLIVEEFEELTKEELMEMQVSLVESADRTYTLLTGLLDWAVFRRGGMEFEPALLDLNSVVIEASESLGSTIRTKGIDLEILIDQGVTVMGDRKMVSSVISNLLTNAIKFTPTGGRVRVSSFSSNDNRTVIKISDTGIGIPERMIGKLFKMAEKTGRKGTNGEATTGLGLLLCKEFTEKMEGTISVESREGEGTTFTVELPAG